MVHSRKSPKLYLQDIHESITILEGYIANKNSEDFETDIGFQDKVIRRMEIIGEAAKYIPDELRKQTANIPWVLITDMRNVLVHEYFGINLHRIWEVASGPKLKDLKLGVEKLLKDL